MGCCVAKNRVKEKPQERCSMPSVLNEKQTPSHHHSINTLACGYTFNINPESAGTEQAKDRKNRQREEQKDLYQQFQLKYMELKERYQQHDIDSCLPILEQIEPIYHQLNFNLLQVSDTDQQQIQKFISNVRWLHSEMLRFTGYIDKKGWEDQGVKNNIHTYTKRDGNSVAALNQTQINVPVEVFLTILGDMDLIGQLNPDVKECRQEKYIERNHKIGYCLYDIPILALRQVAYEGVGYNRLKHNNTILLYSQSIHNRPDICQRWEYTPRMNSNYVQIEYKYVVTQYEPIGVNKGKVTVAINNDLKLNFVPMRILEMITKMVCNDFIKTMVNASKKYEGSKWEAKVKKHPETYNFFKEIITRYYQQNNMI